MMAGRNKTFSLSVLLKFSANRNTPRFPSLFSLPIFGWMMAQLSKTPCCIPCSADCLLKKSLYLHGHIMAIFSEPVIPVILQVFEIKNNGKRIKSILLNVTVVTCCLQNSRLTPPFLPPELMGIWTLTTFTSSLQSDSHYHFHLMHRWDQSCGSWGNVL